MGTGPALSRVAGRRNGLSVSCRLSFDISQTWVTCIPVPGLRGNSEDTRTGESAGREHLFFRRQTSGPTGLGPEAEPRFRRQFQSPPANPSIPFTCAGTAAKFYFTERVGCACRVSPVLHARSAGRKGLPGRSRVKERIRLERKSPAPGRAPWQAAADAMANPCFAMMNGPRAAAHSIYSLPAICSAGACSR